VSTSIYEFNANMSVAVNPATTTSVVPPSESSDAHVFAVDESCSAENLRPRNIIAVKAPQRDAGVRQYAPSSRSASSGLKRAYPDHE
jgi:hypothetical protein